MKPFRVGNGLGERAFADGAFANGAVVVDGLQRMDAVPAEALLVGCVEGQWRQGMERCDIHGN